MSKTRIYVEDLKGKGDFFVLSKDNSKIVKTVLRSKKGDDIELIDGRGSLYKAEIEGFDRGGTHIRIYQRGSYPEPYSTKFTLLQAVPKGKRIDYVVQKMVELGVDRMIFFFSERSVPSPRESKLSRLEKIAVEALRQSQRLYLPEISIERDMTSALRRVEARSLKLVFHEEEGGVPLREILKKLEGTGEISFVVGPEGGFTYGEVKAFKKEGFKQVILGKEVLRTDTAPVVIAAILNHLLRW